MQNNLHSAIFSIEMLENLQSKEKNEQFEKIREIQDFLDGLIAVKDYAITNNINDCYLSFNFFQKMPIFENPINCWFFQKEIKSTYEDFCNGYVLIDFSTINHNIQYYQDKLNKLRK